MATSYALRWGYQRFFVSRLRREQPGQAPRPVGASWLARSHPAGGSVSEAERTRWLQAPP